MIYAYTHNMYVYIYICMHFECIHLIMYNMCYQMLYHIFMLCMIYDIIYRIYIIHEEKLPTFIFEEQLVVSSLVLKLKNTQKKKKNDLLRQILKWRVPVWTISCPFSGQVIVRVHIFQGWHYALLGANRIYYQQEMFVVWFNINMGVSNPKKDGL